MSESPHFHSFQTPREYYSSFTRNPKIQDGFDNIDDGTNFKNYLRHLQNPGTRNFVLDFGNDDAWCAVDMENGDLAALLQQQKPGFFGTRWINIWAPEEQKDMIRTITSHYGVSERLRGMMCTEPVGDTFKRAHNADPSKPQSPSVKTDPSPRVRMDDLEEAQTRKDLATQTQAQTAASFRGLTFAHVTDQIWHFCSVDHGPRYTCLGFNSLYIVPNVEIKNGKHLPDGKRLWSWLILFNDGTVLSIQENPYPGASKPSENELRSVLGIVRRNVQFIFAGVSYQHSALSESDSLVMVTIRVRHFRDAGPDDASIKQDDGPSLLFFYIFDDWPTSYALVAKREHRYGVILDELRQNMLTRPAIDLVNELHTLGRQLGVLKRLYQSYELIMLRILQQQRTLRDEARSNPSPQPIAHVNGGPQTADAHHQTPLNSPSFPILSDHSVGVRLSPAAVTRFERLLDRIKLYCLSELETCLTEKESMTFLNFNLIALKDSQAVEKLTRITILLAKVTILFLPVSLMTGYFSTELVNVKGVYTVTQYWVAFAVIMVLSILVLVMFGYMSDTVEGKPIYRSFWQTFFRSSKDRLRTRQEDEDLRMH